MVVDAREQAGTKEWAVVGYSKLEEGIGNIVLDRLAVRSVGFVG